MYEIDQIYGRGEREFPLPFIIRGNPGIEILGYSRPEKSRDPGILQNPVPEIPGLKILDPAGAWWW